MSMDFDVLGNNFSCQESDEKIGGRNLLTMAYSNTFRIMKTATYS